jgi:MinD superfamily P-loop ATPase
MNFKKKSIFRRGEDDAYEPEVQEESGGVLAVWGSPGSGKTITAVKLAKMLAEKKKNVALVMCDMTAPMLPCICPPSDLECERSLGGILAVPRISDTLIKNNCITHKRLSYLTILGMKKGENEYTYPPYTEQQATEFLDGLRELVPYIIVDCGSYIANDILSAIALMEADSVLRLANCDLKSVGYFSSQLPLLKDTKWDADKQYKVASNVKPQQAAEHIGKVLGSVSFKLPYSQELEEQYLAGALLSDLTLKDSRAYRKELERILKEVFGC